MLKKITFIATSVILGVTLAFGLVLVVSNQSVTANDTGGLFKTPNSEEQKKQKGKIDKHMEEFRNKVVNEIKQSANISLAEYKRLSTEEVFADTQHKSLGNVYLKIMMGQEKGDIKPYVLLNANKTKGVIIEKKKDGTNTVYIIEFKNNMWKKVKQITSKGKQMKPEPVE